jgi:hypothetical protein
VNRTARRRTGGRAPSSSDRDPLRAPASLAGARAPGRHRPAPRERLIERDGARPRSNGTLGRRQSR